MTTPITPATPAPLGATSLAAGTHSIPPGAIVVGVDGSAQGERALEWAGDQAAREHRPLALVHAAGWHATGWLTGEEARDLLDRARVHGEELVADAATRVTERHPRLVVQPTAVVGDARSVLLDAAEQASMLVVGSRGRGPVRSLLLGSVSLGVARHALCPVVVVRPHPLGVVRRGVLVGADGTAASLPVLEFAYRQASLRRRPLTVMHCVWDVVATSTGAHVVPASEPGMEEARLLLAESVSGLSEKFPDVHVTLDLARGLPDQCLLRAAERMDLLVVGRHHTGSVSHLVFGSVAASAVERAGCVVAVVPES